MHICHFLAYSFKIFSGFFFLSFLSPFLFSLSFYPLSLFYPLEMFWPQSFQRPGNGIWSTRWLGLFYHQFCTRNWTSFFWNSSVRIWSIFKMGKRMDVLAAYQVPSYTGCRITNWNSFHRRRFFKVSDGWGGRRWYFDCGILEDKARYGYLD